MMSASGRPGALIRKVLLYRMLSLSPTETPRDGFLTHMFPFATECVSGKIKHTHLLSPGLTHKGASDGRLLDLGRSICECTVSLVGIGKCWVADLRGTLSYAFLGVLSVSVVLLR